MGHLDGSLRHRRFRYLVREEHEDWERIEWGVDEHIDRTCSQQFGNHFFEFARVFDCVGVPAPAGCSVASVQGGFAPRGQINRRTSLGLLGWIRYLEIATTVGTVVAYLLVPMRSLGSNSWKIAAALMGRHIGGAVNYVAISDALGVSPSILAAGLAADNVICAVYFSTLFALASRVPPEPPVSGDGIAKGADSEPANKLPLIQTATSLAVSLAICKAGHYVTKYYGIQGGILPAVTAIVVILATVFPRQFAYLAPTGEAMAMILMQVFFTVVGASGNIWSVINTAPSIFLFALIQVAVHLAVILGMGKLFGFELKQLLIASNANVGGPTTACGMATAKEWPSMIVPGILVGIFGIAIATFIGIGFGVAVLKYM
ncbi:uncharacterized membrane protein YjcL isoform X2 [Pyrus x bretschneideri]|uniref:uncharacterized membrane protein YjcL isoform X2 n=1 Tax=Pyrus x bretschneideri TaxID=225117 RepID=UPI00202E4E9B|nr:uncharacterized membrane protein YjcL isoform X2 [Pyrus x bretschneideri]